MIKTENGQIVICGKLDEIMADAVVIYYALKEELSENELNKIIELCKNKSIAECVKAHKLKVMRD